VNVREDFDELDDDVSDGFYNLTIYPGK